MKIPWISHSIGEELSQVTTAQRCHDVAGIGGIIHRRKKTSVYDDQFFSEKDMSPWKTDGLFEFIIIFTTPVYLSLRWVFYMMFLSFNQGVPEMAIDCCIQTRHAATKWSADRCDYETGDGRP